MPRQEKEAKTAREQDDECGKRGIRESCAQDKVSVEKGLEKPAGWTQPRDCWRKLVVIEGDEGHCNR